MQLQKLTNDMKFAKFVNFYRHEIGNRTTTWVLFHITPTAQTTKPPSQSTKQLLVSIYSLCVMQVLWLKDVTCQWKLKASSSFILPSLDGTQSGGTGCTSSEPTVTSPNTNRARMANQPPNRGCTHTPNIFWKQKDQRITAHKKGKDCL